MTALLWILSGVIIGALLMQLVLLPSRTKQKWTEPQETESAKIAPEHEDVPHEFTMVELTSIINSQSMGLRKIPLAIRVIYCFLWHLDRRVKQLEKDSKEEHDAAA